MLIPSWGHPAPVDPLQGRGEGGGPPSCLLEQETSQAEQPRTLWHLGAGLHLEWQREGGGLREGQPEGKGPHRDFTQLA